MEDTRPEKKVQICVICGQGFTSQKLRMVCGTDHCREVWKRQWRAFVVANPTRAK